MSKKLRVGIAGGGWPGQAHAKGYMAAGGFEITAVADLIPDRRKKLMSEFGATREFATAEELVADPSIDVVSVGIPTHLHGPVALAALKAGKHVLCETPPATSAKEVRQLAKAAEKAGKVLLFALQRRFGGPEQASQQAIAKGYAGDVRHARAAWMRTRGVPLGTGWYTDRARAGGGAMWDVGLHMLDLAWHLMGRPKPETVFAAAHKQFRELVPSDLPHDVEDSAFALVKFENGRSLELSAAWAINQPPHQQGTICRLYGQAGCVDVYTPEGAVIWRGYDAKGQAKPTALRPPKTIGHAAIARHFRACIEGKETPSPSADEAATLMDIVEAIGKSAESGKSVGV
jgi:predicted dehydrogenase